MLNFWYSEHCTREIKLIISVSTCVLIFLCSAQQQLEPIFAGLSIGVGVLTHLLYQLKSTSPQKLKSYLNWIWTVLPILCLCLLIYFLPHEQRLFLAVQCLGFAAIGLFIVSIYSHREKRT